MSIESDLPVAPGTFIPLSEVEVRAISVNPVDTKVRRNTQPEGGQPKVLGWDVAGVVVGVGSEVSLFKVGDEVFYAGSIARAGGNSERHLVDERIVGRKPRSLSFAEAAALPLTAITAWELLFERLQLVEGQGAGQQLLIVGAAGKSAQIPLYVWLPDAMEGPTPVSALIHAATMVTAGVYLVARCTPLFVWAPTAQLAAAAIGAATALIAALTALTQNDLKRVMAYSTVSQLGYMFMALGAAAVGPEFVTPAITVEYGHYLAAGCTGCHGANFSGGKIDIDPPDWPQAANLTPYEPDGFVRWTEADFIAALRTQKKPDGVALSPVMPKVFGAMNDTELKAIWMYLRTLPPVATGQR